MRKLKEKYIKIVEEINEISEKNGISINDEYKNIAKNLEDFIIKIPLIGAFNAGKSTLLNQFMGENTLPVEITPETAIACEIKFGYEERVIAHSKNKEVLFSISDIKNIFPVEYEYIELYKNNENLKKLTDIIFVDMPGLDSNLEYHNKAILNYIQEGVEFLVLSDIENGGLKASVLEFIKEITNYNMNFSILITKTDLKDINGCNGIYELIRKNYNEEIFIGKISSKNGNIEDFYKYINQLDCEGIFRKKFTGLLNDYISDINKKIEFKMKSSILNQKELEEESKKIQDKIENAERKLEEEQKKLEYKMITVTKNSILKDVEYELEENIEVLTASAKTSKENFSRKINNITRNVVVESMNKNVAKDLKEFINDLKLEIDRIDTNFKSEDLLVEITTFIETIFENPKIRALLIGGAVFTNIVAPIIEVVIIFLPEILKLLGIINSDEKIRMQIKNSVIPEILDKLSENVINGLIEIKEQFTKELKLKFEEEKNGYIDLLKKIEEEKNNNENEYHEKIAIMKEEQLKLEKIRNMI